MVEPVFDHWTLPAALRAEVERELAGDEPIVWLGQPDARRATLRTWPIVAFAVPWTGFAVFWIAGAAGFKMPTFQGGAGLLPLFGVPFVLIGLAMLTSPLWSRRSARRTVYAITDRRAVIFERTRRGRRVRSFPVTGFGQVTRTERADGSGDLILHVRTRKDADGDRHVERVGFYGIPKVREVERLLRDVEELNRTIPRPDASGAPA
ncbi:MAG: hypothetical protein HKO59_13235 [Phycisphaerales bacterium]|nr:hypothetical protein [Phycisphaerae bacterium]NNF42430.1 hypothetical protein [Phycisphaerales bacterium]NNM26926.1 hypothetical protein [Phycisphaerales bacterium]